MSADYVSIWAECFAELQKNASIPVVSLDVFIRKLAPIDFRDGNLILMCETAANKAVINKNYLEKMQNALHIKYPGLGLVIVDQSDMDKLDKVPAFSPPQKEESSGLNPNYTFSNFVIGLNNRFVQAAASAVAENPGGTYNPLFIYSGVGLGKTHVMNAIGNHVVATRPEMKVRYLTCETFTNEFIESIRLGKEKGSAQSFRNKYRSIDVLMIDDIQFIANKTGTQEEFFHTFNDLYNRGKQIVISSDQHPKDINPLEERLRSRFGGGLIADMQPPDLETRIAILQKKAQLQGYNISGDVLQYIAEINDDNVRIMVENLTRAYFYSNLNEQTLTVEVAAKALKDSRRESNETLSINLIIDIVCRYYSVNREDLIGKKKNKEIVYPRMMCIYLITEIMSMPLASIGQIFGGRDHTTIMHARNKISEELKNNPAIKLALHEIRDLIYKK